jgi:hypothetical protein
MPAYAPVEAGQAQWSPPLPQCAEINAECMTESRSGDGKRHLLPGRTKDALLPQTVVEPHAQLTGEMEE